LKCLRRAADVAWVKPRARDVVRIRLGSAAEMWIGVSGWARLCSESVVGDVCVNWSYPFTVTDG
jgi:hypothetical protein